MFNNDLYSIENDLFNEDEGNFNWLNHFSPPANGPSNFDPAHNQPWIPPSSSSSLSTPPPPLPSLPPQFPNSVDHGNSFFSNPDIGPPPLYPINYNCATPSLPPELLSQSPPRPPPPPPVLQPAQAQAALQPPQPPSTIHAHHNICDALIIAPRFISPYVTPYIASFSQLSETGSGHNRLPIMISASRLAFTSQIGDSSSPSSPCSTSRSSDSTSPNGSTTMDKKLFMNNPLLVNMLTCPQIPGLRNLAPAPDSSSSHLDEKPKNYILSGLIDSSGDKRKRSVRSVAATSSEPVKRQMRPKIFDIEQFKIGLFHVQSSTEGNRRTSSTQLKVIFSKRRFIYEFAFSGSAAYDKKDSPVQSTGCLRNNESNGGCVGSSNASTIQSTNSVVYYVIAVPFEIVTGLNIAEATMYLTVDRVPFLFGGTSVRSKVLFEKAPRFDPSQGELESNALHCLSLKQSQVGRLQNSLVEFDKRFADLLSTKIGRDPFTYRCKLSDGSRDKEDDKSSVFTDRTLAVHHHHHHLHQQQQQQQQQQQPDSNQQNKKPKLADKADYPNVQTTTQSNLFEFF